MGPEHVVPGAVTDGEVALLLGTPTPRQATVPLRCIIWPRSEVRGPGEQAGSVSPLVSRPPMNKKSPLLLLHLTWQHMSVDQGDLSGFVALGSCI